MVPRRYLSTSAQPLTLDNRNLESQAESQQDEIRALRQARERDLILLAAIVSAAGHLADENEILRAENDRLLRLWSEYQSGNHLTANRM